MKNEFHPGNKLLLGTPSDYIVRFYLNKYKISDDFLTTDYYPEDNIFILVNKYSDYGLDMILESHYGTNNLNNIGFSDPESHYFF